MIYTERIQRAIRFSLKTHEVYQKQKRKGKDIPYVMHPFTVGLILARAGASEDVIIAGILHDTIEDSVTEKKVTKAMIAERFGENVANIVDSVTEQNKSLSWQERKDGALVNIASFSHDSLLVKSADLIGNASEILEDYAHEGRAIFDRFNGGDKMIHHYIQAMNAVMERWLNNPLLSDLAHLAASLSVIT